MGAMPSEPVLKWVAAVLGSEANIVSVKGLHEGSSPWLLHVDHDGSTSKVLLRVADMGRIWPQAIATGAAALQFAEAHGIAAPRLIASDLDDKATGAVATLETVIPGSSASPPQVSAKRLQEAGAALARVHAIPLTSQRDLPLRLRPTDVDDRAMERRWTTLYHASSDGDKPAVVDALCELTGWSAESAHEVLSGPPSTPLLHLADERLREIPRPQGETVFVHGDIWAGNMMWQGDSSVTLIDWKNAGAGDPGVDLGNLRLKMALQYGLDAAAHVLEGWQRESGQQATHVAYWDIVAALTTPTNLDEWETFFDAEGNPLDELAKTKRRDAFLRKALNELD